MQQKNLEKEGPQADLLVCDWKETGIVLTSKSKNTSFEDTVYLGSHSGSSSGLQSFSQDTTSIKRLSEDEKDS